MDHENSSTQAGASTRDICGIVMPIAEMPPSYSAAHWKDVRRIVDKAIEAAGYTPRMVSEAAEVNVIQASIVTNLAENPIVVCDVSGKNANCMFELGLRLAFDKPTIIIKDELTGYSFDTGPVKHLNYRSDLRFQNMMDFMDELAATIKATAEAAADPSYSPFLGSFGKRPKNIPQFEGDALDYVLSRVDRLAADMSVMTDRLAYVPPKWREQNAAAIGRMLSASGVSVPITDDAVEREFAEILKAKLADPALSEKEREMMRALELVQRKRDRPDRGG